MIESFGYGLLLALAFIGFISFIYYLVLHFSRFEPTGKFVVHITNEMSKNDIHNLIYGINIRRIIFGDQFLNEIIVINSLNDTDRIVFLNDICESFCGYSLVCIDELNSIFTNKGV